MPQQLIAHSNAPVSDSDLQLLRSLFGGDLLQRSLDILDRCAPTGLTCYRPPAASTTSASDSPADVARSVFEVPANRAHVPPYKLLPAINFCTCQSYRLRVLLQPSTTTPVTATFTCKHVLACRLAQLLRRLHVRPCTADELNAHLEDVLLAASSSA